MKNLTPMQAAYWTGREAKGFLGNVSAHLYVEFDGSNIDPIRLEGAVRKLYETHAMLCMQITADGRQVIGKTEESLSFEVEDLSLSSRKHSPIDWRKSGKAGPVDRWTLPAVRVRIRT